MDREKVRDLKEADQLHRELEYYYAYEPEDKESISRLEEKLNKLMDSGTDIITEMSEDLLKQKRKSND